MKETVLIINDKKYKLLKNNALEYSMEIPKKQDDFMKYDLRKESKTNIKGLKKVEVWGCKGGSVMIEGFAGYHASFERKNKHSINNESTMSFKTKDEVKSLMAKKQKLSKRIIKRSIKIEKSRVLYHEYYKDNYSLIMLENAIKWNGLTKIYDIKIVEEI